MVSEIRSLNVIAFLLGVLVAVMAGKYLLIGSLVNPGYFYIACLTVGFICYTFVNMVKARKLLQPDRMLIGSASIVFFSFIAALSYFYGLVGVPFFDLGLAIYFFALIFAIVSFNYFMQKKIKA